MTKRVKPVKAKKAGSVERQIDDMINDRLACVPEPMKTRLTRALSTRLVDTAPSFEFAQSMTMRALREEEIRLLSDMYELRSATKPIPGVSNPVALLTCLMVDLVLVRHALAVIQ